MKFSILTVSLNAGDELIKTAKSVLAQTYTDIELIIKDGGSSDGSAESLKQYITEAGYRIADSESRSLSTSGAMAEALYAGDDAAKPHIRMIEAPDTGIYDAMNQALQLACGDYVLYLNCGDYLYDDRVLEDVARAVGQMAGAASSLIFYGDIYDRPSKRRVPSNPHLDEFGLFRNIPCHQACFYRRELLLRHPLDTHYSVRSDYEQFLWCVYEAGASLHYIDRVISSYQGGGFSETKENRRISAEEHRRITERYMGAKNASRYHRKLILSLAPVREFIARNPLTSGFYNGLKSAVYRKK